MKKFFYASQNILAYSDHDCTDDRTLIIILAPGLSESIDIAYSESKSGAFLLKNLLYVFSGG